jgi:pimeloyl-ACP methyl ester carboxylesterase
LGKALFKYLKNLAIVALSLYLALCLLLYFSQENLLFHPQPKSISETSAFLKQHPDFDTLSFVMEDNTRISVFLSTHDTENMKRPLVIYFGGNAEEVSHLANYAHHFKSCTVALVNNRGFGRSGGSPSEKNMFSDALRIYDQLKRRDDIDPQKIILVGRSIGTGVATYLSSKRPVRATILFTPYESMTAVAQGKYPFVPISFLIKHPFESQAYAANIATPVLALIAKHDVVIPPPHAHALLKHWKGESSFLEVDADHVSILDNDEAWQKIEAFLALHSQ